MMQREIPGFYFDKEKRKYFRIQKNHVLPPGSAHTRASVKVLQDVEERDKTRTKFENRVRQTKVTRSPLSSRILDVRLGSTKTKFQAQSTVSEVYARNLSSRLAIIDDTQHHYSAFTIDNSGCLFTSDLQGRCFIGARPTNDWGDTAYANTQATRQRDSFDTPSQGRQGVNKVLATTGGFFVGAGQSSLIALGQYTFGNVSSTRQTHTVPEYSDRQIWDIAGSTTQNGSTFAVAMEDGVLLIKPDPGGSIAMSECRGFRQREQMTIAFKEPNIIMSGERSGRVNLTDTRSPHETIARLHHSSPVTCLRNTKHQSEIIVQGFSTTSIYDLRYTKSPLPPPRHHASRKSKSRLLPSTPVLNLAVDPSRQSDQYTPGGRKLAYSSDLNLIVSASCKNNPLQAVNPHVRHQKINRVTVYSATTGKVMKSPLNEYVFGEAVGGLEMKRIRDGPESIVILEGGRLVEWGLHMDMYKDRGGETGGEMRKKVGGDMYRRSIVEEWEGGNRSRSNA